MVNEEKLNILVEEFRGGSEEALNTLCKMFLPVIQWHSEQIWYKIEKQTEFECRCILKIKKALLNFDRNKGSLKSLITYVITKEKYDFLARRKRKLSDVVSLDEPLTDHEGNQVYLEVVDVLADVETNTLSNHGLLEKVALLAKGDPRRLAILKAWSEGETNDLQLAKELACSFPEVSESGHRRFIQRFRIECQKQLASVFGVQHRYCV